MLTFLYLPSRSTSSVMKYKTEQHNIHQTSTLSCASGKKRHLQGKPNESTTNRCSEVPKMKTRPIPRYAWFPRQQSGKESACQCRRCKRCRFNPWVRKVPQRRKWQPTPAFSPGAFHRQRSLAGYSPGGHKKSDMTEHTHTYTQGMHFPQ